MEQLIEQINKLFNNKKSIVIAIDGKSCAGKTTLANKLKEVYDANVIHTDDFYLPKNLRTVYRLKEVGGHFDYDRLYNEVIRKLNKTLNIVSYDCKNDTFIEKEKLPKKRVTIIEGTYSMHPYLENYYDFAIFMNVDGDTQLSRLKERNLDNYNDFIEKLIPYENRYLEVFKIKDKANIIL